MHVHKPNQPTYDVDQQRDCTRYTLRIPGSANFPPAMVTARVIPDRLSGTYRVIVAAGSKINSVIVHDLCQHNIDCEERASSWARECIRAAEQFWHDCTGSEMC